jgi:pimeloyl-ACP methyl ester carboxylesterase
MNQHAAPPEAPPRKRRWLLLGCLAPVVVIVALAIVFIVWAGRQRQEVAKNEQPEWVPQNMRWVSWASPAVVYNGPGELDFYSDFGCAAGDHLPDPENGVTVAGTHVHCLPGVVSQLVRSPRQLFVHRPAGYDPQGEPLPVIIAVHGFGQRPHHSVLVFIEALDEAQRTGRLPKAITVFPDFTLGGAGLDDITTPWDENGGNWGINSNQGRYADHFTRENYRASDQGAKTILLGGSMGGTVVLNAMLDDPQRFPNIGAFYPALDIRYSCNGNRLGDYDPQCYQPLTTDDPSRRMTTNTGIKGRMFTEKMFLLPVFDSDKFRGDVWREDKPVWERVRENNPVDRLRDKPADLRGVHVWYVVGDQDDFNIDAQTTVFNELAVKAGIELEPPDHIRPGRHDLKFFADYVGEAIDWMARRLAE